MSNVCLELGRAIFSPQIILDGALLCPRQSAINAVWKVSLPKYCMNNHAIASQVGRDWREIDQSLTQAMDVFAHLFPESTLQLHLLSPAWPVPSPSSIPTIRKWKWLVQFPDYHAEWQIGIPTRNDPCKEISSENHWGKAPGDPKGCFRVKYFMEDLVFTRIGFELFAFSCQEPHDFFIHRNAHYQAVREFFLGIWGQEKLVSGSI